MHHFYGTVVEKKYVKWEWLKSRDVPGTIFYRVPGIKTVFTGSGYRVPSI